MSVARLLVLVVAGLAAVFVWLYVRSSSASTPTAVQTVVAPPASSMRVLVASRNLQLGVRITPPDLTWREWPEGGVAPEYMTDAKSPQALQEIVGSVVRDSLTAGEPVLARKLVAPGASGFMAAILTPGLRAVSVRINAESGAGGFILPGDHVDVILSYQPGSEGSGRRSRTATTILENVRVLAIDQSPQRDDDDQAKVGSTATLELTPADAEMLTLAHAMGHLTLVLRSVADINPDTVEAGQAARDRRRDLNGIRDSLTVYRYGRARRTPVRGQP